MLVQALQVERFRNLAAVTFVPGPRFNVLHGDNGQGKTNLLEALYLAGTLRSFRTTHAQEMIGWGAEDARVAARVARAGIERVYEIQLAPRRKSVKLDGKTPRSLGEYFGDLNVVLFAPEDLRVPRGSPAGRRRFLDRSVFNRRVTFLEDAQRYARVLRSRNAVLREPAPNGDLLDVYDEQLATLGALVIAARRAYLDEFGPRFAEAFGAISRSGLDAALRYEPAAAEGELAAAIQAARRKDLSRRQSSVGPHVDDVTFLLGGREARAFASQGQLRALVLAWKTAEMRFLREVHGDSPILLLDDVSSELDPSRNQFLFDFLVEIECQCFVTTTHPDHVPAIQNRLDFRVVEGVILAQE